MESKIRYDFSFPPKSNNIINTQNYHHLISLNGNKLTHSISQNHTNNPHTANNISLSKSGTLIKNYQKHTYHSNYYQQSHIIRTPVIPGGQLSGNNMLAHAVFNGTLKKDGTPKEANCSFTFDELKKTLSFMDDSPLAMSSNSEMNKTNNETTPLFTNPKITTLVVVTSKNAQTEPSLSSGSSSSSSNSSELSTSSASSTTIQLNDDPSVVRIIKTQQLSNMHQTSSSNLIKINSFGYAGENNDIECAAKKYRCSAQNSEATCSWKGILPAKTYKSPVVYSTKVFVGGLPWDITEEDIIKEFGVFGPCRVEWTHKEKFNSNVNNTQHQFHKYPFNNQNTVDNPVKQRSSPGFVYVIYEKEFSVRGLVNNCIEDYANGRERVEFFFKISTRRVRNKEVQIIPWILADNNYALCTPKDLDPKKTVFVGNLHGRIGARDLAFVMNELFGGVVYAGIDIDKLKYPIGSGRVTFASQQNFMLAIRASFVDIQTSKFSKRVQIDPYLEDVECCMCNEEKGIYFCRDFKCFNYYCAMCWSGQHSFDISSEHKPLMRRRENKL